MKTLSLVVPCLNEEKCIVPFIAAINALGLGNPLELVFVDDGSRDGTLSQIKAAAAADARIRYVSFSRNFGKEAALLAGLKTATGELVVTMDADLQHRPELIPQMLAAIETEGYDSAAACRTDRAGEAKARSYFAHRFYGFLNQGSEIVLRDGAMDYRMMTRQMADAVLELGENTRFTKGIYEWVGFRTKWIETENVPRVAGRSKWSLIALFVYSIRAFLAFSTAPLWLAPAAGAAMIVFSIVWFAVGGILRLTCGCGFGPTSACVAAMLALTGVQLVFLGIVGQYISGIFREVKRRPLYIVRESN